MVEFTVETKRLYYDIKLKGKYSVVQGFSGRGKSTLCELIIESALGDKTVKVNSTLKVVAFSKQDTGERLLSIHNSIIVIDEICLLWKEHNLASLFQQSDNYFLIISRDTLDWLPLAVTNLYQMQIEGKNHFLVPLFKVENKRNFSGVDRILVEDSGSGKKFFEEYFPSVPCKSAGSKNNILRRAKALMETDSIKSLLIVYDSAAFGYQVAALNNWLTEKPYRVQILDWESFEHFVLESNLFNVSLRQEDLDYRDESLEQASTEMLKKMIPYKKDTLPKCLKQSPGCIRNCPTIATCKYKHDAAWNHNLRINQTACMEVF